MNNSKKYRFAFIIPNLDYGGAEKTCATFVNELSRLGHSCKIFLSEETNNYRLNPVISTEIINRFTKKRGPGKLLFLFRYYSKLAEAIQKFAPDILVSSLQLANIQTLIALKLIPAQKRPFCIIRQEGVFPTPPGFLARKLYPTADRIIAVSEGLRKYLLENIALPPDKVTTLYNPCNLNEVETLSLQEVDHPWFASTIPIIINVARLVEQKDHETLVRAFQKVLLKKTARLLIVGDGPLKIKLETMVAKLELNDSVCFLGFENNPYRYVSKAKVFVLTSRSEGFGNVILEAMSCGTPVISTDCPWGPKEIIEHGQSGYLVPLGDEATLTKRILSVLEQDPPTDSLVENAKGAIQKFDLPNVIEKFLALLPEKK